jgi:16S rRNA processing protein RimM
MTEPIKPENQSQSTGSLPGSEPVFLAIGKIRRPHGVRGEMIMEVYTDFPERLLPGVLVFLGPDYQPGQLTRTRWHQGNLLISLDGITTPESAGIWRNQIVYLQAAERPVLPEGEYYQHELIGLTAISESGQLLGLVSEILETGVHDVLVVRPEQGPEILIPFLEALLLKVDLERKEIHLRLLPGLLPDESEA